MFIRSFFDNIFSVASEQRHEVMANTQVLNLVIDGFINLGVVAVLCTFIIFLYKLLPPRIKKPMWHFVDANMKWYMIIVWVMGFVTYFTGSYVNGSGSIFNIVPMAIIHASGMFLGVSDISAIRSGQHDNALFMALFDMSHFLALAGSLVFIVRQFGYYISASIKIRYEADKALVTGVRRDEELFVFWGITPQSIDLAKSIPQEKNWRNNNIIFVRTFDDSNHDNEQLHFGKIFDKVKMKYEELRQLRSINCLITSAFHRLSKIEIGDNIQSCNILKDELELVSLVRLIKASKNTRFFLLSEDYEANINASINLLNDTTIQNNEVHIYCRARKNSKTKWLEHYNIFNPTKRTSVSVVDPAYLAVLQLKMSKRNNNDNIKSLPINYVTIDTATATVTSPFNSMIIGYGEVGYESLRFLYEFGTFVDKEGKKAPFHCTVIDKDIDEKNGIFNIQCPGLIDSPEIEFLSYAIDDKNYWNKLKEIIPRLNYIIISTGSDDLTIETAVNIATMANRWRDENSPKELSIFVQCNKSNNSSRLENISNEINRTCKASGITINTFGNSKDLFCYDVIVHDKIRYEAQVYNYVYEGNKTEDITESALESIWNKCLGLTCGDDGTQLNTNFSLTELEEIERKIQQCISNALHASTKLMLLEGAEKTPARIVNVAKLEHARWISASMLQGWIRHPNPTKENRGKDIVRKYHCDICPWNEIRLWDSINAQRDTQSYDIKVVETSIRLNNVNTNRS